MYEMTSDLSYNELNYPKAFFEARPHTHEGEALLKWWKLLFHV